MDINEFIKLNFVEKYEYSIKKIARTNSLWVLRRSDGTLSLNVDIDNELQLLIWADAYSAEYNLVNSFKNNKVEEIDFHFFIQSIAPKLEEKNIKILLSVMREKRGKIVKCQKFIDDVNNQRELINNIFCKN